MKRKEPSTAINLPRKRVKPTPPSSPRPSDSPDTEQEFKLRAILQESKTRYLIDWEDNEVTGEKYKQSWEPKQNANKEAVDDWNRRKAKANPTKKKTKGNSSGASRSSSVASPSPPPPRGSATKLAKRRSRLHKVIPSSSQPDDSQPSPKFPTDSEQESGREVSETQPTPSTKEAEANSQSPWSANAGSPSESQLGRRPGDVHIPEPPSSYTAGAYEQYSLRSSAKKSQSVRSSQHPSQQLDSPDSAAESAENSPVSAVHQFRSYPVQPVSASNREVPDSASGNKSSAYAVSNNYRSSPARQRTSKSSQNQDESQRKSSVATDSSTILNSSQQRDRQLSNSQGEQTFQVDSLNSIGQRVSTGSRSQVSNQSNGASKSSGESLPYQPSNGDKSQQSRSQQTDSSTEFQAHSEQRNSHGRSAERSQGDQPIDLATTQYQFSISITPQSQAVRQHLPAVGQPIPTNKSSPSSFPFETQVHRPSSSVQILSARPNNSQRESSGRTPRSKRSLRVGASQSTFGHSYSSPFPSVPSQSIAVTHFGESAPLHPSTPSPPVGMTENDGFDAAAASVNARQAAEQGQILASGAVADEKNESQVAVPPRVVTEDQQPALATVANLLAAQEQRARSPSAVPAHEILPDITQEEQNTSEAVRTLLPQTEYKDDQRTAGSVSRNSTASTRQDTNAKQLGSENVYVVPIVLVGHQRDLYPQTIYHHRDVIEKTLNDDSTDTETLAEAADFIGVMNNVTLHPDLCNPETLTQYDVEPAQQANWDVNCSAKFRFLKSFLNAVRGTSLHIIIAVGSGRITEIITTFMQGIDVRYRWSSDQNDGHSVDETKQRVKITLLSSVDATTDAGPADVVIAMDSSITPNHAAISSVVGKEGSRAPFLTLVVPRSAEHIEVSLPRGLDGTAEVRTIVKAISDLKWDVGKRGEGQMKPDETAEAVAQHIIAGDTSTPWPIPSLKPLENLQILKAFTSSAATVEVTNSAHAGDKHPLALDREEAALLRSAKRARVDLPDQLDQLDPQQIDITHVSDSVKDSSQMEALEERFKELLGSAQARVEEHVEALSGLQYRYEDQRTKLLEVTQERDAAIDTARDAVARFSEQSNQLSTLRAERSALRQELEVANARLTEHSVPERAEFELLRIEAAKARAEKEKIALTLTNAEEQLDYLRKLYQTTSNAAQTSASRAAELANEVDILKKKASGEQARVKQISVDLLSRNLQNENRRLKSMLKDRDAALKFRDEEIVKLKEASRGRMGTRGTSVPRSPRLGSPMKMGSRSRQGSPAAGELRGRDRLLHPLRNA